MITPDLKSVATELSAVRNNVGHQFKVQKEIIELQTKNLRESMEERFGSRL